MWVSGDKILAVGAYQDMEDVASAHVRRIDMNGQMIIPYQIGSLAKGKKANFCVLNRNVFEVPVDKLGTTAAVTVVFEGSPVKGGLPYRTVRQEAGSQSDIPHHRLFRTHRYSRIQWDRS